MKPRLLAVHPQTGYLYVATVQNLEGNPHSSNLSVISGTQILTRLPLIGLTLAMIVNPVDQQLYVGHHDGRGSYDAVQPRGLLTVISGTHLVSDVMPIP